MPTAACRWRSAKPRTRRRRNSPPPSKQNNLTLDQCRAWVEAHPETKRPLYQVPHTKGVVGNAANFVYHIAARMAAEKTN